MKYENVVFPDGIGFKCKHCGFCCRYMPGDVNAEEQRKIETKGFTDFTETPDITGLRLIRRKNNGSCYFLASDNKCEIYEDRPMVCRLAPFTVTDWEYEKNIINVEARLDLFCPGLLASEDPPPPETVKAAQEYVQEKLKATAQVWNLPTTSKKVTHQARNHIITGTIPFLKDEK